MDTNHKNGKKQLGNPAKSYFDPNGDVGPEFLQDQNQFRSLLEWEEVLVRELYLESIPDTMGNSPYDLLREELDIAKAYHCMKEVHLDPLPEHLRSYAELNLEKLEKKESIVLRLTQAGIHLVDTLTKGLNIRSIPQLAPEYRTTNAQVGEGLRSTLLEEKLPDHSWIYYQFIQESPGMVFLSIQVKPKHHPSVFKHILLKREGRVILSSQLNEEGFVNFSGLKEGEYSIEFVTPTERKVVDLSLLNG